MEPNSREFYKQCAFQKFCNTVLHNEACDAHKELHRHKAKEITFSDLTLEEARQLHTFDEYFKGETAFERAGHTECGTDGTGCGTHEQQSDVLHEFQQYGQAGRLEYAVESDPSRQDGRPD